MRYLAFFLTLATATPVVAQSSSVYSITHVYPLGGAGGWDYIVPDPPNHRLYIGRENRVMVVDEDTGELISEVTGVLGAHGTAIVNSEGHGFATSAINEAVIMFELKRYFN